MPRANDNKVVSALREFGDATTAHGVPRAVGSFSVVRRLCWSAFFVASLAYFLFQAHTLLTKYFKYPVATDVSIKFATIDFPAVTICNLNPVRVSKLKTVGGDFASEFAGYVDDWYYSSSSDDGSSSSDNDDGSSSSDTGSDGDTATDTAATPEPSESANYNDPDIETTAAGQSRSASYNDPESDATATMTTAPRQFGSSSGPGDDTTTTTTAAPSGSSIYNDPDSNTTATAAPTPAQSRSSSYSDHGGDTTTTTTSAPGQSGSSSYNGPTTGTATTTATPGQTPAARRRREAEADQDDSPDAEAAWEDPGYRRYRPQEHNKEEVEDFRERRETGPSSDDSYDSGFYAYGSQDSGLSSDNEEYDDEFQLVQNFSSLILELNRTSRKAMGHQYKDLVLECTYDGKPCSKTDFRLILDEKYGNCYTFNSKYDKGTRRTKEAGPAHGLQTTLNIEQDEYVPAVTPAAGVRVVLHQPGEWPFPAEEGFDVGPGYSTSIGLQVTTINRLGGKYGNCTDGKGKDNLYTADYSTKTCWYTCFQRRLVEECACGSRFIPLPKKISACPVPVESCEDILTRKMRNGDIWCDCPPSCVDNTLTATFGFSEWPASSYESSMLKKLSKIDKNLGGKVNTTKVARENLLKLSVYFEQLNLQTISESPAYGVENLLGDLGGQLGLWLGVSVMTILEVCELIVDIIQILLSKAKGNKETKVTDISDKA